MVIISHFFHKLLPLVLMKLYQVCLHYPDPENPRPIIMVGAPGVGCDELRLRLIGNKAHYASPIPHTTRSPKQAEINGRDLVFVTRPEMERKWFANIPV